jgi:hypothetical protein
MNKFHVNRALAGLAAIASLVIGPVAGHKF